MVMITLSKHAEIVYCSKCVHLPVGGHLIVEIKNNMLVVRLLNWEGGYVYCNVGVIVLSVFLSVCL